MLNNLTQKRLKEVLHYDPDTGIFQWKERIANCIQIGNIAGTKQNNGYIYISIKNKLYKASRLAWLYMEGYFPENDVDHEDRIKDNDRWNNLRHLTRSCNRKNSKISSNNTTGVTGIQVIRDKWFVTIGHLNKSIKIGLFSNFIEAVKARWKAEIKYNWPNCNTTSSAYLYLKERNLL